MFEGPRGALEEVTVQTGCMTHWEKFRSVKLHCHDASRRHDALGLCTAHRA